MAIKAIIGLGNEGEEYQATYHNVGAFGAALFKKWSQERGLQLRFFELNGFMNTIGTPVAKFIKKNNLNPSEILIIQDESDLLIGDYRISSGGGAAGHKGVASVLSAIEGMGASMRGSNQNREDFSWEKCYRLRIGIRDPKEQVRRKAIDFVLRKWSVDDEESFTKVLAKAWDELAEKELL